MPPPLSARRRAARVASGQALFSALAATIKLLRWMLLGLVAIWGLRLSFYIYRRSAGKGEDPRYADLLRDATSGQVVRRVFLLQGFAT